VRPLRPFRDAGFATTQQPGEYGDRFVPGNRRQIAVLIDVYGPGLLDNGYLTCSGAIFKALENRFDAIRMDVHDDAQIILGSN
jgi:hypothetical protein